MVSIAQSKPIETASLPETGGGENAQPPHDGTEQ